MKEDSMFAFNSNSICEQARPYYYEYLCEEAQVNIPGDIAVHINLCNNCQAEVKRLKLILVESKNDTDKNFKEINVALITNANLRFGHIGELVSCRTVKPFLPSLADPVLKIGIPTPITVHLDNCKKCEDDLKKILELKLTHKQLCRLGQIFAELPYESQINCLEVNDKINEIISMVFKDLNENLLKHVSTCPDCRDRVYQCRERHIMEINGVELTDDFSCDAVKAADLFDFCFPYGIGHVTDGHVKLLSSFTSHVNNCPSCLNKMQDLHKIINDTIERDESGIVTCYKVVEKSEHIAEEAATAENIYNDWPIKVEVTEASNEPVIYKLETATGIKSTDRSKQKFSKNKILSMLKYAPAAAAIILLAIIFMYTPVAKALNLTEVYNALGQVRNVYITVSDEMTSETSQEILVSHDLNIKMFKSTAEVVLWDFKNQVHKVSDLNTASIETSRLDIVTASKIQDAMEAPWDVLPFKNATSIPRNAEWQKEWAESSEVYDLIWTEKLLTGSIVFKKCRVYLNISTKLPYKTEWFERKSQEDKYELLITMNISYPLINEIRSIMRQNGFE
ncbi:MAG: hypothetical protein ACYST2_02270 [Planctomycetota bacterium]|jgi:hypothetical protein